MRTQGAKDKKKRKVYSNGIVNHEARKPFFDDHAQKMQNEIKRKKEHAMNHSPEQGGYDSTCKYCTE